jgi:hypothetical protein
MQHKSAARKTERKRVKEKKREKQSPLQTELHQLSLLLKRQTRNLVTNNLKIYFLDFLDFRRIGGSGRLFLWAGRKRFCKKGLELVNTHNKTRFLILI